MLMADRRSWSAIKHARRDTAARRHGYRRAREAFQLGERVRQARERVGMTQAELASRIGSTQPAVARLEAGGVTPSLDTLRRIAVALDLELIVDLRPVKRASA
jgi:ribosome-binding protein aMBF1 (putative translation factor)